MNSIEEKLSELYKEQGKLKRKRADLGYIIRTLQEQIQILEEEYNNSRQQKMF